MLGGSTTFKRHDIAELRIIDNDTYSFGSVDRRTASDGDDKIGSGILICLDTGKNIRHCGIRLHIAEYGVWDISLIKHVGHHLGYTEFNQSCVGHHKSLVFAQSFNHCWQLFASAGTKVRYFVKNKSIYHVLL